MVFLMADLAKLGFEVDTKGLKKGEKALDDFAKKGEQTEKRTESTSKKVDKNLGKIGRSAGQAGIQFQQLIGQIQGGQSVMLALSQQSADLGFVLGAPLLGAIGGITASLVGILLPSLFDTKTSLSETSDIVKQLTGDFDNLDSKTKKLTESLLKSEIQQQEIALKKLKEEAREAIGFFDLVFGSMEENSAETAKYTANIVKLELELKKSKETLEELGKDTTDYSQIVNETDIALNKLITSTVNSANTYGMNARELAIYQAELLGANEAQIEAINIQFDRIDALKEESEALKNDEAFSKRILTLEMERQQLTMTADEYEIYQARMQSIATGATPEMIKALEKTIKVNQKLRKEFKSTQKILSMDELTREVENFGGAWSRTGSVIIDTFGDISDSIDDYMSRIQELDSLQISINERRKEEGADQIALNLLQQQVNDERLSAELSGAKSVSSAVIALTKEDSKARKAALAINKAIAVAEIALSLKKIAQGWTETAAHTAQETTKQGSNALTAITGAFAAGFPVGFIAGAAMIAIMAALLGGSFGGGGSFSDPTEARQEAQGTGTLLGSDEKSQSILESQERFEDIQIDQLAELRGIRTSLGAISDGISLVTRNFVAAGGIGEVQSFTGTTGATDSISGAMQISNFLAGEFSDAPQRILNAIFGTKKRKVTDAGIEFVAQTLGDVLADGVVEATAFFDITTTKKKLFGAIKKVRTSTENQALDAGITDQIGAIFQNIGMVVTDSAALLGFDVTDALNQFQIDIGKISLEGLSGEEIEQELQAIFSQQADLIAGAAIPGLEEFQKVGEGLFDTLTRVAQEQVIFNDAIDALGFNLSDLSSMMQIDVAQSVINLTGGLEKFSDLAGSFVNEFFTEAEQFEMLEQSITEAFDSLGLSMVNSKEEFRDLIEGLDLTTESGQALFAALLEISPAFADYVDELEKAEKILEDGARNAFAMLEKAVKLEKQRAQAALDAAREAHRAEIDRLNDLKEALEKEHDLRTQLLSDAESVLINSFDAANQAIEIEKDRAAEVLQASAEIRDAELARISGLRQALNEENSLRKKAVSDAERALKSSFGLEIDLLKKDASERIELLDMIANEEIDLIKNNADARINSLENERDALDSTASSMRDLVSNINSALGLSGSTNLVAALASARAGRFEQAQQLDIGALIDLDAGEFATAEELAIQEAVNRNRLATISGLAETEATQSDRMIAAIDRQINTTRVQSEAEILAIENSLEEQKNTINEQTEAQVAELQEQLNMLLGIDDSVLSISDAIAQLTESQKSLEDLNFDAEQQRLDALVEQAHDAFALDEQAYNDEISRLDQLIENNNEQLNAVLGINTSVLSVEEAIKQYQEAQISLDELNYEEELAKLDMLIANADEVLALHEQAYQDELERLDKIISDNEALLNAALGIDDSVLSVAEAIEALNEAILGIGNGSGQETPEEPVAPITEDQKGRLEGIEEGLKGVQESNEFFQRQIVKNTNSTARILQRIEIDGLDTRPEQ